MALFFERVSEIQSLPWSPIQADHFQDKSILLNCFHFPSEVTALPPQEASHRGNITLSAQPWRSYLAALARVLSLRHHETRYGSSWSHHRDVNLRALRNSFVIYRERGGLKEPQGNRFIWGCSLNPANWVSGCKNVEELSIFISIHYKLG